MRKARALFGVSLSFALAGGAMLAIGACGGSNSSNTDLPTTTGTDASGGSKDAGTTPDTGNVTPPGDAGSDCGKPAQLFVSQDGGFLCPFSAVGAGGKDTYCSATQECCETPKNTSPSTCQAKGSPCPVSGSTQWECQGPENCGAAGQVCCAHSGDGGTISLQQDVCGPYLSKFDGTVCKTSCAANELVVCQTNADCPAGATCTAVKPKGTDIGICH